jgi:hypothetical protein
MSQSSRNGDGKDRAPFNRISSDLGGQKPSQHEQQIIDALKVRYDEIEALWNQAEEDLRRFRVPYSVEHWYSRPGEGTPPLYCGLAWTKHGKAWRICHVEREARSEYSNTPPEYDPYEWTPIIDCPLALRLSMIDQFAKLRQAVIEAAEKTVPKLDEAIANFRGVLQG